MEIIDIIRNAESAPKVFSALSGYIEFQRQVAVIPDWLLRLPLRGAEDVGQRTVALLGVINLASQNMRDGDCRIAKRALQVFAAATWRLRSREHGGARRRELQ